MKEIQRLSLDMQFAKSQYKSDESGNLVYYSDHAAIVAALQEQVQKLAAENSTLIGWIEMDTMTSIDRTAFKSTDAVIREIGAKAVDELAAGQRGLAEVRMRQFKMQAAQKAIAIAELLEREAARLRAGEVS